MTTSDARTTNISAESPDRLSVRPSILLGTVVDGAWWPRSSDLVVELPRLLRSLWGEKATDVRVAYHLGTWNAVPRKVIVGNRLIRLGGFVHQDPLVISLSGAVRDRRVDLLVIDPTTPPDVAAQVLRISASPDCTLAPAQIVERAVREAAAAALVSPDAEQAWENEGGHEFEHPQVHTIG
jgi:hypothetical protein